MAALHHGADGDDGVVSDQPDPSEEVPFPRFLAGGDTTRSSPAEDASSERQPRGGQDSGESGGSSRRQRVSTHGGALRRHVEFMSPSEASYSEPGSRDPWSDPAQDPWGAYMVANEQEENWSEATPESDSWERW